MSNHIDVASVKRAARNRWPEILSRLGGIPQDILDGKHHPCPKCGGVDRFRFTNRNGDGSLLCNQCFNKGNGDGISALEWLTGQGFGDTIKRLAEYLGIQPSQNGHANGQPKAKKKGGGAVYATLEAAIKVGILPGLTHDYPGEPKPHVVRTDRYDTFVVLRFDLPTPPGKKQDKTFRPVHSIKLSDGRTAWRWGYPEGKRPLFRRKELAEAIDTSLVVVCAGEKATEVAVKLGLVTTTCAGGERAVDQTDWGPAAAFDEVVVSIDNDPTGQDFGFLATQQMQQVKPDLPVKILLLPDLPPKGDIVEWAQAGGTREKFLELAEATAPVTAEEVARWQQETEAKHRPRISNAKIVPDGEGGFQVTPRPMNEVIDGIFKATGGWPKRVGDSLFVQEGANVLWLTGTSALFAWLGHKAGVVEWSRVQGCVTKDETTCRLSQIAKEFASVEAMPHYPPIPGRYYTWRVETPGDSSTVARLLDFFCPETPEDRQLSLAALLTPIWGGQPGTRPAFMFTARSGRGRGKTKAAQFSARVHGGHLDISPNEDIGQIKSRLLTAEAAGYRVAMLDNVKTTRFSWGEMEALITSDVISGRRLYVGNANRPNDLTWYITLNGASLSTDMAQRTVEIKLADPVFDATWDERIAQFIDANRRALIADLVGVLQRPTKPLPEYTRWASWDSQILSRLDNPAALLDLILARRGEADVEVEEGEIIESFFASKLCWLEYDPEIVDVFLPNEIAARWYNQAVGDNRKTAGVTRALRQLHDEGRIHRIVSARGAKHGERGFRWIGEHSDSVAPTLFDVGYRLAQKSNTQQKGTTSESDDPADTF